MRVSSWIPVVVALSACAEQQSAPADAQVAMDASTQDVQAPKDTGIEVFTGPAAAPRPLAPLSTAMVNTRRPLFRWSLAQGSDGAVIEVCRDRSCNDRITQIAVTGSTAQPESDLPPGLLFWRLRGRRGPTPGETTSPVWQVNIATRNARATTAFGTILDINGDGRSDLAAGAPGASATSGTVSVYVASGTDIPSLATFTLRPPDANAKWFGLAVASAGDLDGDGYGDLVVGAPGELRGTTGDGGVTDGGVMDAGARDAGRTDAGDAGAGDLGVVLIYKGGPTGLPMMPTATLTSPSGGTLFGARVASAGDVNGDGYGDLLVAASGAQTVYLYPGGPMGVSNGNRVAISGSGRDVSFASAVAGPGDVNGDGFADILVGSPGEMSGRGAAFLYLGASSGPQPSGLTIAARDMDDRRFGESLAGAGDVNKDGYADILIGSPGASMARGGRAYVYTGTPMGVTNGQITTLAPPEDVMAPGFGATVANAGDVNSDGSSDVLVAAPYDVAMPTTMVTGRVFVYLGSDLGVSSTSSLTLEAPMGMGSRFGFAMAIGGDVNADTFSDIFVAEPRGMESRGRVHVYAGGMMGLRAMPTETLEGSDVGGLLGSSVAGW